MSEFLISLFVILMFGAALDANINQGIGTSLITLNAVIVSGMSYCIFREKITVLNGIGIVVILVALAIISLFGPKTSTVVTPGQEAVDVGKATTTVVIYGVIAAFFSASECIFNKILMIKYNVPGDVSGICFQFFEGIVGTICLIVLTA